MESIYDDSSLSANTEKIDRIIYEGYLKKWTNYYYGWQDRYVILEPKRLSYFKDREDTDVSSKGSVNIARVRIIMNNYDENRFDIKAGKAYYFFRADTVALRNLWIHHIESLKVFVLVKKILIY